MNKEELYKKFDRDVAKRSRLMRLLLATDQWFNVLLYGGSQDETISSHIQRRIDNGTATWFDKKLCCFLNLFEESHCTKSLGE